MNNIIKSNTVKNHRLVQSLQDFNSVNDDLNLAKARLEQKRKDFENEKKRGSRLTEHRFSY